MVVIVYLAWNSTWATEGDMMIHLSGPNIWETALEDPGVPAG